MNSGRKLFSTFAKMEPIMPPNMIKKHFEELYHLKNPSHQRKQVWVTYFKNKENIVKYGNTDRDNVPNKRRLSK
jgi:hypothetical protein